MEKRKIFDSFIGSWDITRVIGQYGTVKGIATCTTAGRNTILYREDIYTDLFSSKPLYFHKEYSYCYNNGEIEKYFVQNYYGNKFFYKLEFSSDYSIASAIHKCGQDFYQATYNFHNSNNFTLQYEVKGMNKDFVIRNNFVRIKNCL